MRTSICKLISIAFILNGCSSLQTVEYDAEKLEDYTCKEIQVALSYAGNVKEDAEEEKGTTLANVTSSIFVPFGLQINQARASSSSKKADKAMDTLYEAWNKKKCSEKIYAENKKEIK